MKVLEPTRLFRASGTHPELAELSAAAQQERRRGPDPAQRARMRAALGLPPSSAPPAHDDATVPQLSAARSRGWWLRRVISTSLVLVLGPVASWMALRSPAASETPPPPVAAGLQVEASQPVAPEPAETRLDEVALEAPAPVAEAPRTRRAPKKTPTAPTPAVSSDPEAELQLLRRARARVHSEPAAALQLIAQHEAEFAHGIFAEEREVIAIDALLARGERASARARATRFLAQHRGSAHTRRVHELLGESPNGEATKARP